MNKITTPTGTPRKLVASLVALLAAMLLGDALLAVKLGQDLHLLAGTYLLVGAALLFAAARLDHRWRWVYAAIAVGFAILQLAGSALWDPREESIQSLHRAALKYANEKLQTAWVHGQRCTPDPMGFSDPELRVKSIQGRCVVYWIGPDGKDDGGARWISAEDQRADVARRPWSLMITGRPALLLLKGESVPSGDVAPDAP